VAEGDPTRVGISITRVFDAPRERVWNEWTEPGSFADWFGGAASEVPLETVSMDIRPGGSWRLTMYAGADRREIRWWGDYREVVRPERLVFTISDQSDPDRYELVTVELRELDGGRTEMQFEQRGTMTRDRYEQAEQGWGTFFDRIDRRLAA
jgi:uncharacterized protein YndB with AHSA1/START domain